MTEVNEISTSDKQDCQEIIYKICELASADIKNTKTEITYRIKNRDNILKFKDKKIYKRFIRIN